VSRPPLRALAVAAAVAAVAGLGGLSPGCKKDKESLVLADLQAMDTNGSSMTSVKITISRASNGEEVISQIFDLPMTTGLPMSPSIQYGVYVPAGNTGQLVVTAVARPTQGCTGYNGSKPIKINAGDTLPVMITMRGGADVCSTAGTAGTGGTTGTGGMGGSVSSNCGSSVGGAPAVVAAPSLTNCTPLPQYGASVTCDVTGDNNNPYISDISVSPDGQLMASASNEFFTDNGVVRLWRLQGGTATSCGPARTGLGQPYVSFAPNGQYVAIAFRYGYIDVYRVPALTFVGTIMSSQGSLYGLGWTPDSQAVISLDYDSSLMDGNLYADRPDGQLLAAGGDQATIRFWAAPFTTDATTGNPMVVAGTGVISGISFHPGGASLVTTYTQSIEIWSVSTRMRLASASISASPDPSTPNFADAVRFSPSGGMVIAGEDQCGRMQLCSD
jgi:WD40 repeat protein